MCQEKDKVSSTILNYYRNELFKPFWEDGRGILGIHGNGYRNKTYTQFLVLIVLSRPYESLPKEIIVGVTSNLRNHLWIFIRMAAIKQNRRGSQISAKSRNEVDRPLI